MELRGNLASFVSGGLALVFAATAALAQGASSTSAPINPCSPYPPGNPDRNRVISHLISNYGGARFTDPPIVRPTTPDARFDLVVKYSAGKTIAGCAVELRSYNGELVGATIRARPGDTLYVRLINKLPANVTHEHPQDPHPADHAHGFSFNITNLHTHGLHTSPSGNSDNVFLTVHPERFADDPKGSQDYQIHIHEKHPTGTFWYHAHFHGSTAVQVTSGMAGAIIIENGTDANGGLDSVPQIRAAEEKIFVLQQIRFDEQGKVEGFDQAHEDRRFSRNVTVNGLFVPTIRMRPGEVQRWRFIHAGIEDNIHLALDGHQLHEIAADGLALGRMVAWPAAVDTIDGARELLLGPGYRADVLVKAKPLPAGKPSQEYYLRDRLLPSALSLQATAAAVRLAQAPKSTALAGRLLTELGPKPERLIARVIVEGPALEMALPTSDQLKDKVPSDLATIQDSELTGEPQPVEFDGVTSRICKPDGDCSETCDTESDQCKQRFTVNKRVFNPNHPPRTLKIGHASEWTLTRDVAFTHPFHIHVNPFEFEREEPDGTGANVRKKIWKDTVLLTSESLKIRSRYRKFTGDFVLHCHILSHEDMGMMESVRIIE